MYGEASIFHGPGNCRRRSTANNGSDHLSAPAGALPGGAGSLARVAASGTKWMGLSQAGRVIAQLLGMVILARLLSPSDYGVVAMAWLVIAFAGIFQNFGTKATVIQRRELPRACSIRSFGSTWASDSPLPSCSRCSRPSSP